MGGSVRKPFTQKAAHASSESLAEPVFTESAKFWEFAVVEVCSLCMALRVGSAVGSKEHQEPASSVTLSKLIKETAGQVVCPLNHFDIEELLQGMSVEVC
jgi:hypothetical protein